MRVVRQVLFSGRELDFGEYSHSSAHREPSLIKRDALSELEVQTEFLSLCNQAVDMHFAHVSFLHKDGLAGVVIEEETREFMQFVSNSADISGDNSGQVFQVTIVPIDVLVHVLLMHPS